MIIYLIYSTICMGLVLLFYHAVLSREKIYHTNRWYLLAGLFFSLIVPLLPIGIFDSMITLSGNTGMPQILAYGFENINSEYAPQFSVNPEEIGSASYSSFQEWFSLFILSFYSIVTMILSFRMIRHLYHLQLKSMKNPATFFKSYKVVLIDDEIVPHTFSKTIFVNKELYENHKISEEVMIHELIHAEQNHSLDIIIVEILKTLFWFNPVLYFYKTAIQANHEYIADEKVLSTGADIADYQTLLLKMRTAKSSYFLSTRLNFNITKKRFKMMTLNYSKTRSYLKISSIIPFFIVLGIIFGCESEGLEDNQTEQISLEVVDAETIKMNGKTVPASQFESFFSDMSIDPQYTRIDFKVHKNASMGLVTDVQEIIRKNGLLRINYSTGQSNGNQSKESWRSNLESRNILDLHINEAGEVIVHQVVVPLSSLKGLVKSFITNNGEDVSFSESPEQAIIAIETVKKTPHQSFISSLEKVIEVYDELRDQASMEMFDKPYDSLPEGSEEKKEIKNLYPKRISITDPSSN